MSKVSYKRLGMALVSLAVPFMLAAPVSAQPAPLEVATVELECLGLGFDVHTCTNAVKEGVIDVHEELVNADLEAQGVAYVVDVGEELSLAVDINDIAINPLPPVAATGVVLLPPGVVAP